VYYFKINDVYIIDFKCKLEIKYLRLMNKNFLTLIAVGLLCVGQTACSSGDYNALQFKTYEARSGEAVVTIDIPQGEDELQQNISKGIFDIMAHSAIAKEAGSAKDGSLNEVADDYSKRMAKLL
jgi:hypothetical protein